MFHGDQGLAHEGIQRVQHLILVKAGVLAEFGGGGEVEPVGEHSTAAQHRLFGVIEKVIGPADGVAEGLMAFEAAAGAGEKPETVIEPVADVLGAHGHHAGRGELDGERDPVETPADLAHCSGVDVAVQHEARVHSAGPFNEQLHRGGTGSAAELE